MANPIRILCPLIAGLLASNSVAGQTIEVHFFGNSIEAGVIAIDGPMEKGLTDRLKGMLARDPIEARRVVLNSPGGSLLEGVALGQLIRKRQWSTEVGRLAPDSEEPGGKGLTSGECFSACALSFLGGSFRNPDSATSLGFHQFHEGGASYTGYRLSPSEIRAEGIGHAQLISGLVVSYLVEMGVDARLFTQSSFAGPSELIRFTVEQATAYGVVTSRTFGDWFLEPYKKGVVAASKRLVATGPYDLAVQTTALCRSAGRAPSLLMTVENIGWESGADLGGHEARLTLLPKHEQSEESLEIPAELVKGFGSGPQVQVEIQLSSEYAQRISNADAFGITLLVGRALGGYSVWHVMSPMDQSMVDAAFRLCI